MKNTTVNMCSRKKPNKWNLSSGFVGLLIAGIALAVLPERGWAEQPHHKLEIKGKEVTPNGAAKQIDGDNEIIYLITAESGRVAFTLTIPETGLLAAVDSDAEMRNIVEGIRSVEWPLDNAPDGWTVDNEVKDLKITINDVTKLEDDDFTYEWEIKFPRDSSGDGMIKTKDRSSHQRRAGDMGSEPDGEGRVSGPDNPLPTTVRLVKTEFETFPASTAGPNKPHELNMDTKQGEAGHYAPYEKAVSVIHTNEKLDMAKFLVGYDDPDLKSIFHNHLHWRINEGEWTNDHELDLGASVAANFFRRFNIQVAADSDENSIIDHLIVTVIPQSTKTDFDGWYTAQSNDKGWLDQLPAIYGSLILSGGSASDPEPEDCSLWRSPTAYNKRYHPGADYEIRSEPTAGGHSHQVMYKDNATTASLIVSGISAGTADRVAPFFVTEDEETHFDADVLPFIWAAQLDGNPVRGGLTDLTDRILHEGYYLNQYLEVRPPIANSEPNLTPGECPPNE